MLHRHQREWRQPLKAALSGGMRLVRRVTWRRGFPEGLILDAATFFRHAAALRASLPLRRLMLESLETEWPLLLERPELTGLANLTLAPPAGRAATIDSDLAAALTASPALRSIRSFTIVAGLTPAVREALRPLPGFGQLDAFVLTDRPGSLHTFGEDGIPSAGSHFMQRLGLRRFQEEEPED